MRRREFVALLGSAAAAWPVVAHGQQTGKLPTIGFLGVSTPLGWSHYVAAFQQRLSELGWIEGRTINIEMRWAEGRSDRFAEIAAEFVRNSVAVIVTAGGAGVVAKQATSTIPIVFALANDPVGAGLVASLARPGSNVTGMSAQATDLAAKRLRTFARICSWNSPFGDPRQRGIFRSRAENGRGSGDCPQAWARCCSIRNPTSGGYRPHLRGASGPSAGALCRR